MEMNYNWLQEVMITEFLFGNYEEVIQIKIINMFHGKLNPTRLPLELWHGILIQVEF